jgi:serine/threonine protein phosphatase PrpC
MTEKEMRRRQDKALKKRSKQIRKEREQLKEKERKVKEMAKIQERRGNAGEGVVVALPDIDCRTLSPDDRFILIASDGTTHASPHTRHTTHDMTRTTTRHASNGRVGEGLWDVCPSKESVKVVSQLYMEQQLQATAAPVAAVAAPAQSGVVPVPMLRNICESVCRSARKGGSSDDITCLLIALHPTII